MTSSLRFLSVFILSLLAPLSIQATIFTVTNTADTGPGSLRGHINQAQPNDTIRFSIHGTIFLDSTIWLTKNLHIQGPGPDKIIIDGKQLSRLFRIQQGDTLYFSGMTFQNGNGIEDTSRAVSGGAFINEGFLILRNAIFYKNIAKNGGAIENAGYASNAELDMAFCTFYENRAIEVNDTIFNTAFGGGAIYANGNNKGRSVVRAQNCTFSQNFAAESGGGIYLFGDISGGTELFATNCTFTENISDGAGAIRNERYASVILTNSIVADNNGQPSGPDIQGYIISNSHNLIGKIGSALFTPEPTDIVGESALLAPLELNGGSLPTHALSCLSPAIDAGNDLLASPTDQRGQTRIGKSDIGAYEWTGVDEINITHALNQGKGSLRQAILLACDGDTLDMRQIDGTLHLTSTIEIDKSLTIWGNQTLPLEISGGDSIRLMSILSGKSLNIDWITFKEGNPELYGGGAILNKGHLTVSNATFRRNQAAAGGAIANYADGDSASFIAMNCTFSGNKATIVDGGAIDQRAITNNAFSQLINCTVYNNQAVNKGGGIYNDAGGVLEIKNTIIAKNKCENGPDVFGNLTSQGHNLLGNDQEAVFNSSTGDLVNTDPQLAYLANYGGPTFTHRVLEGSPVIDAGDANISFEIDQRGESRMYNGKVDIGAYEYDPTTRIFTQNDPVSFSLYPNPNHGEFTVQFANPLKMRTYQIFSVTGQLIKKENLESVSRSELDINLGNIPAGIYVFMVESGNEVIRKKFIIE